MNSAILHINGGIGKNIIATSLLEDLNKKYNEILVTTAWPNIFNTNKYVNRVYKRAK